MKRLVQQFNDRYKRYLIASDVNYNHKSTLDIYGTPKIAKNRPIIIFWYGGSWQTGDKSLYRFVADYLAHKTGAVIIVPNYQKFPAVKYPHFIDEAWQVVTWIHDHAAEYGASPDHYSVIGHSSGAHTACSVALGSRKPAELSLPERCVSLSGPNYEVGKPLWPVFDITTKDRTPFPVYFIEQLTQPSPVKFMALHALLDIVVSPAQFIKFRRALIDSGTSVVTKLPLSTHPGLIIGLGSPFANLRAYARQVVKFLK